MEGLRRKEEPHEHRNCVTKHRGGVVISGPWSILVVKSRKAEPKSSVLPILDLVMSKPWCLGIIPLSLIRTGCQKYCLVLYYCLRHKTWWYAALVAGSLVASRLLTRLLIMMPCIGLAVQGIAT